MNLIFEYATGPGITPVTHAECLSAARELVSRYGGVAQEIQLLPVVMTGEPDSPYCPRATVEKAVLVDTSLDALAEFAADRYAVVQVLACSHWHWSTAGRLTHRVYVTEIEDDEPQLL